MWSKIFKSRKSKNETVKSEYKEKGAADEEIELEYSISVAINAAKDLANNGFVPIGNITSSVVKLSKINNFEEKCNGICKLLSFANCTVPSELENLYEKYKDREDDGMRVLRTFIEEYVNETSVCTFVNANNNTWSKK